MLKAVLAVLVVVAVVRAAAVEPAASGVAAAAGKAVAAGEQAAASPFGLFENLGKAAGGMFASGIATASKGVGEVEDGSLKVIRGFLGGAA